MEWYKYTNYSKWTGIPEKNRKGENEAARKLPDIQISPTRKDKKNQTNIIPGRPVIAKWSLVRKKMKKTKFSRDAKNRKVEPVSALIKFV